MAADTAKRFPVLSAPLLGGREFERTEAPARVPPSGVLAPSPADLLCPKAPQAVPRSEDFRQGRCKDRMRSLPAPTPSGGESCEYSLIHGSYISLTYTAGSSLATAKPSPGLKQRLFTALVSIQEGFLEEGQLSSLWWRAVIQPASKGKGHRSRKAHQEAPEKGQCVLSHKPWPCLSCSWVVPSSVPPSVLLWPEDACAGPWLRALCLEVNSPKTGPWFFALHFPPSLPQFCV